MTRSKTDNTGRIIAITGGVAMLLFSYMIICFFRLDWIRYDVVERSWQLESMQCENQTPVPVIHLYDKTNSKSDIAIRYSKLMFDHVKQRPEKYLSIKRKLIGYLREWDYGIIIPLSIAGMDVDKRSIILEAQRRDCDFKVADRKSNQTNAADTRRKMR